MNYKPKEIIHILLRFVIVTTMWICGAIALVDIIENFSTQWYWIVLAFLYTITVTDVFCHRICAHRMFPINTKSITYKILTWLASADYGGSTVITMVLMHNSHHEFSDQGRKDLMNWRYHWYSGTLLSPIPPITGLSEKQWKQIFKIEKIKHKEIVEDPWTIFCDKYQLLICLVTCGVLYLISPLLLFNFFCLSRLLLSISIGLGASIGHMKNFPLSYRNFDTNDTSSNNIILHYLFLGYYDGVLQNNHHGRPGAVNPNPKWWEVDTSLPVVLALKYLMSKK